MHMWCSKIKKNSLEILALHTVWYLCACGSSEPLSFPQDFTTCKNSPMLIITRAKTCIKTILPWIHTYNCAHCIESIDAMTEQEPSALLLHWCEEASYVLGHNSSAADGPFLPWKMLTALNPRSSFWYCWGTKFDIDISITPQLSLMI